VGENWDLAWLAAGIPGVVQNLTTMGYVLNFRFSQGGQRSTSTGHRTGHARGIYTLKCKTNMQ
jgi:hypothetical protein